MALSVIIMNNENKNNKKGKTKCSLAAVLTLKLASVGKQCSYSCSQCVCCSFLLGHQPHESWPFWGLMHELHGTCLGLFRWPGWKTFPQMRIVFLQASPVGSSYRVHLWGQRKSPWGHRSRGSNLPAAWLAAGDLCSFSGTSRPQWPFLCLLQRFTLRSCTHVGKTQRPSPTPLLICRPWWLCRMQLNMSLEHTAQAGITRQQRRNTRNMLASGRLSTPIAASPRRGHPQ